MCSLKPINLQLGAFFFKSKYKRFNRKFSQINFNTATLTELFPKRVTIEKYIACVEKGCVQ